VQERRLRRLEQLIKARVASVLLRDMNDPKLGLVTVTKVSVDKELAHCNVYWSVFGDEHARRTHERLLAKAAGYVQHEVAEVLETRTVPRVHFVFDESVAGAIRIEQKMRELRAEREAREAANPPPPPPEEPDKPPSP
jgi:ribosome-binding factor A